MSSIFNQTYPAIEVLLFDNGSHDGSVEYVNTHYPAVQIIELGRNVGFSAPNNEGIRRAKGPYILTLNTDVVIEADFIDEMVKAIETTDENVGWVAGKMLKLTSNGRTDEVDCLGHHMARSRYATETDYSRPFRWEDYSQYRFVFGASACGALYRREMLEDAAIHGEVFDEDFFAYFEDVDLDWRAQQRGWKCLFSPKAVGYHVRGGTGLIKRPEIAACYLSNRILVMIKNDEITHVLEDTWPIVRRFARDLVVTLMENPKAVLLALGRICRKTPGMLRKRRIIRRRRLVSTKYLRGLIR